MRHMSEPEIQTQNLDSSQIQIAVYGPYRVLGYNQDGLYAYAVYGILVFENGEIMCKCERYFGAEGAYSMGIEISLDDDIKTIDEKFSKVIEYAKQQLEKDIAELRERYPDAEIVVKNVEGEKIDMESFCDIYESDEECREELEYVNDERFRKIVEYANKNVAYLYWEDPYSDPTLSLPSPFEKCAPRCLDNP